MSQVDQIIQNYLGRLVRKSYGTGDSATDVQLSKDAYLTISQGASIDNFKIKYQHKLPQSTLENVLETLEELANMHSKDELASYLVTLDSHTTHISSSPPPPPSQSSIQSQSFMEPPSTSNGALFDRIHPYDKELGHVDELDILHSLVFTLTGSTSELFPFDNGSIGVPKGLGYGQLGLLYQLFEPCLIYKKFSTAVYEGTSELSQTKVAFLSFIGQLLPHYTQYVNQVINPQILEEKGTQLTLRWLHLQLNDWIVKLKFFNYLSLRLATMTSSEFLSLLDQLRGQGDLVLRDLTLQLFQVCAKPFAEMVKEWTLYGELSADDAKSENFFIQEEGTYDASKAPGCFSARQSYLVYHIGKCLNFLKHECQEIRWCESFKDKYTDLLADEHPSKWDFELAYKEVVIYCYKEVLQGKYNLLGEMANMHSFLLMEQGDFIHSIVFKGSDVLSQSSNALSGHQLIEVLQDSIENTSVVDIYPREVTNRLDARVAEVESLGTLGWEVFTLDYALQRPLDGLFEADHKEYLRMFNFMFRLVRVRFTLDEGWSNAGTMQRQFMGTVAQLGETMETRSVWITKTFKRINILRNEFVKFMSSLIGYLDIDVIDVAYGKFMSHLETGRGGLLEISANENGALGKHRMRRLKGYLLDPSGSDWVAKTQCKYYNLDELVELHHSYIRSISRCKILDTKDDRCRGKHSGIFYIEQIGQFIGTINKFVELSKEFDNVVVELISMTELTNDDSDNQYDKYFEQIDTKFNRLMDNLTNDIINPFEDDLEVLVKDLAADADEGLRYLGIMLGN